MPFEQFARWYAEAKAREPEADAMTLATASAEGPSARMVLLKTADARGFVFYTTLDTRTPLSRSALQCVPRAIDFGEHKPHRLHDRQFFRRAGKGWHSERRGP